MGRAVGLLILFLLVLVGIVKLRNQPWHGKRSVESHGQEPQSHMRSVLSPAMWASLFVVPPFLKDVEEFASRKLVEEDEGEKRPFLIGYRTHTGLLHAMAAANTTSPLHLRGAGGGRAALLYLSPQQADAIRVLSFPPTTATTTATTAATTATAAAVHTLAPFPPAAKVDGHALGPKLEALSRGRPLPPHLEGPSRLKAVLPPGALSAADGRQLAERWTAAIKLLAGSEVAALEAIQCRADTGVAVVCAPVADGVLAAVVAWLAAQHAVVAVELWRTPVHHNRWARQLAQTVNGSAAPVFAGGLRGEGQVIAISDTGIDMNHCFFKDAVRPIPVGTVDLLARKVVQYIPYGDTSDVKGGHGSHVAGTAAGDSLLANSFGGAAPGAKIAFFDLSAGSYEQLLTPSDLSGELFSLLAKSGAHIFSNSWGTPNDEGYSSQVQSVDDFMYSNEGALIVFAGGNEGEAGARTISSPSNGKNCLTVGASQNAAGSWDAAYGPGSGSADGPWTVASFSSRGPTADGRIKPDVVAPGEPIFSAAARGTLGDCTFESKQGTSSAAPLVAGMAALVREYFQLGFYPTGYPTPNASVDPCGALVKAMLIHSAVAMRLREQPSSGLTKLAGPPSMDQGFGRPVLSNVLLFGGQNGGLMLYVRNGRTDGSVVADNSTNSFEVNVTTADWPLKATLVWVDPPAAPNSARPLINDLDLRLEGPAGERVFPNGRTFPDTLNTVEACTVSKPALGKWRVVVMGRSVCCHGQPYALVISGAFSSPVGAVVPPVSAAGRRLGAPPIRAVLWAVSVLAVWLLLVEEFTVLALQANTQEEGSTVLRQTRGVGAPYKGGSCITPLRT